MLTAQSLKDCLPSHLRSFASQEMADKINNVNADPEFAALVRENFVSFTSVLKEGKFKMDDYLNAVTFVSFSIMGFNNAESWKRTFPQRYQTLVNRGADDHEISAYVSAYKNGKLVNLLFEQTMIPVHVLNRDIFQKAIKVNHDIMMDMTVSAKVRVEAASSLMTHLKPPETKKMSVDLHVGESAGMGELKDLLGALAQQQLDMIEGGMATKHIAHQALVPQMKDVTPDEGEAA